MARHKGTPEKLDPAVVKAICDALEIGLPEKYAAEAAGVSEMTFHSWLRKGGEGIEPYKSFSDKVMIARAKGAKHLWLRAITGGSNSQAAQWGLERRFRREFGAHLLVGGVPDGDPIKFQDDLKLAEETRELSTAVRAMHDALEQAIANEHTPKRLKP